MIEQSSLGGGFRPLWRGDVHEVDTLHWHDVRAGICLLGTLLMLTLRF